MKTIEIPDEVAERICEAHWNHDEAHYGVKFHNIHQINACNHRLAGVIDVGGVSYGFIVRNGDIGGFEVEAYDEAENVPTYCYDAPEPTRFMFVPMDDGLKERLPSMYKVYEYWTTQKWFVEKLAAYHYDRHFQPGGYIENAYRDWAAKKGMKIALAP